MIGLVGAIGTDLQAVAESLQRHLTGVGYGSSEIHVSYLLHILKQYASLADITDKEKYYDEHMDGGNRVCEQLGRTDAMALLTLLQIRATREEKNAEAGHELTAPLKRHSYIVNSLKRPEEIRLLKRTYGDGFVLLAAYASRERRRDTLAGRIAKAKNQEAEQCRHIAERLIDRDEFEASKYGQDVSHTFFRADAFIDAAGTAEIDDSVRRFVDIVFGHPFETPTPAELGMEHAYASALRSADLSRQVGSAICTADGQVLATGTNDVPKPGGGLYWSGDDYDFRDFRFAERDEPNAEMKRVILQDLLTRLKEAKVLAKEQDVDAAAVARIAEELKESRFMDITEFGRAVHAEMAAITDAARRGVSVQGATLYCTTFPCHNCAKHIVAGGLREVIYIEPYPKSQVARLFSDSIALDRRGTRNQVSFTPFVGFAPTRFADFFVMRDRVDANKQILSWDAIRKTAKPRVFGTPGAYLTEELTNVEELRQAMRTANIEFAQKGGEA